MRSCARRRLILRWRSSTAGTSHDRVHRRSPRGPWGRADLQGVADRPLDLSCACRQARQSGEALRASEAGYGAEAGERPRLRGELRGIWRAQDLACLLYTSDAADEEDSVDLGGRRIIKK